MSLADLAHRASSAIRSGLGRGTGALLNLGRSIGAQRAATSLADVMHGVRASQQQSQARNDAVVRREVTKILTDMQQPSAQAQLPVPLSRQAQTMELYRFASEILSGRRPASDIETAADQVAQMVASAQHDPALTQGQRDGLASINEMLQRRAEEKLKKQQAQFRQAMLQQNAAEDEDDIRVLGRADIQTWPAGNQFDDGAEVQAKEVRTPGSSNVYSFVWTLDETPSRTASGSTRNDKGTLFVTFKLWHPGMKVAKGEKRPDERGPMYAYSNIVRSQYELFLAATSPSHAGGAVWDYLRIRGTKYGHQHPYRLVGGAQVPHGGIYVPRKATRAGFATRFLPGPGQGRARLLTRSSLAPTVPIGHTLQSAIKRAQGRGQINRGRP